MSGTCFFASHYRSPVATPPTLSLRPRVSAFLRLESYAERNVFFSPWSPPLPGCEIGYPMFQHALSFWWSDFPIKHTSWRFFVKPPPPRSFPLFNSHPLAGRTPSQEPSRAYCFLSPPQVTIVTHSTPPRLDDHLSYV